MAHAVCHADLLESLLHALLALGSAKATIGQRQFYILLDREVADEIEALEDEADLTVADAGPLGKAQICDRMAVQGIASARRCIQQPQDREQGLMSR